jgi:hypothetical protein
MSSIYFRLISLLIFVYFYAFDFIPIVWREYRDPRNPVRKVSLFILSILCIALITFIPSVLYQIARVRYGDIAWFRNFVTITATIGGYANLALLWSVMHYRYIDK